MLDSPATTTPRRRAPALAPDERRSAIVEATIPLLLEHGDQVTTRQIATAAGIAEGTIFRVFHDKDALIDAAVDAALDPSQMEEQLAAIDPGLPLPEIVAKAVQLSQRRLLHVWRLVSTIGPRAHDHKRPVTTESPALTRLFEAHRDELTVTPKAATRSLRALTFAMTHPLLVERPAPPREVTRLFLHGVATPC